MTDKFETLSKRLKEVADAYKALKDAGIDDEILQAYLQQKTKLSKKSIIAVLEHTDDFYKKLMKGAILDELEK